MTRHDLPSGNWVEIRDYRELTGHDVRRVNSSITGAGAQAVSDMRATLIECLVEAWSFDHALPATPATTGLLGAADYVALEKLTGNAFRLVNGQAVIPDPDEHADPTPPTQDSTE